MSRLARRSLSQVRANRAMLAAVWAATSGSTAANTSMPCDVPITTRHCALDAGAQQQPVELDALVAQWVRLVDADERGRQPAHIVVGGERRPRQGIPGVELFDAVGDRAAIVVQVEEDAFVLDR